MKVSDAAKRCSDIMTTHLLAGNALKWAAIRLSDGSSDGVAYDTRADAVRHQLHETQCAYVKIPLTGMPPEDAETYLAIHRKLYDNGFRLTDPEDRRQVLIPPTSEAVRRFLRS